MFVASFLHFFDEGSVPGKEGPVFSYPSLGFGMLGVSFSVGGQYGPQSMQLAVLAKQVIPAEAGRREIPNPHDTLTSIAWSP